MKELQLLIDAVIDYAIYVIDLDGTIVSWNSGAERLKGYTAEEIIGSDFSVFFTPEDQKVDFPKFALDTARKEGRFESGMARAHRLRDAHRSDVAQLGGHRAV